MLSSSFPVAQSCVFDRDPDCRFWSKQQTMFNGRMGLGGHTMPGSLPATPVPQGSFGDDNAEGANSVCSRAVALGTNPTLPLCSSLFLLHTGSNRSQVIRRRRHSHRSDRPTCRNASSPAPASSFVGGSRGGSDGSRESHCITIQSM